MTDVLLCKAASEVEANAVVAYLASQSRQATVKHRTIIAYPGVAEPPGPVAEVWVDEADFESARQLLDAYDAAAFDEAELEAQALAAPRPVEMEPPSARPLTRYEMMWLITAVLSLTVKACYHFALH